MTTTATEQTSNEDYTSARDDSQQPQQQRQQRYPSTNSSSRHSTPNSMGGEKQFQFGNNHNLERYRRTRGERPCSLLSCSGSGQNSRTSSVAESVSVPTDGFSNYTDVIQHLQTGP